MYSERIVYELWNYVDYPYKDLVWVLTKKRIVTLNCPYFRLTKTYTTHEEFYWPDN